MSSKATERKQYLDPLERSMEVLFGLIGVLTYTGSLSVQHAGHHAVDRMLVAALGCNLAWGLIDGIMYLIGIWADRGRRLHLLRKVRASSDPVLINAVTEELMPPVLASVLSTSEIAELRDRIAKQPEPPLHVRLLADDVKGAFMLFLLMFLSTLPVALPFLFIDHPVIALRVSNAVAIVLLFFTGRYLAAFVGFRPWPTGLLMVLLGSVAVTITIALGG